MPPRTAVDGKAQARVLTWFDERGRHLPWRETRDPYRTLVAEVMLQQTQTGRVAPSYEAFLGRFPTVERLAHAPAMDVILAWRGLGYN
ncbi:MAG: A/G-specific adenine glycosylase, partial [Actinomycetota bacterium]